MTNYKIYRIQAKKEIREESYNYIRFWLDDSVEYSGGSDKSIRCVDHYPFCNWHEGQDLEIDNDITCYRSSYAIFDNTSIVRISNSTSMVLVRTQADYSKLRDKFYDLQSSNSSLYQENSDLQKQLVTKEKDIEWGKGEIVKRDTRITEYSTQLNTTQQALKDKEGELTITRKDLRELGNLFNNLQIRSNNKDNKIEELEESLGKSRKENFKHEIRQQEEKLEIFVQQLGIDREKVLDLHKAYRKLIQSREENYNQGNIDTANESIEKIKGEFLKGGWLTRKVSVENTQKLCRKCERVAQLRIEQEKLYQEQYEARQEVPPHNNN